MLGKLLLFSLWLFALAYRSIEIFAMLSLFFIAGSSKNWYD